MIISFLVQLQSPQLMLRKVCRLTQITQKTLRKLILLFLIMFSSWFMLEKEEFHRNT